MSEKSEEAEVKTAENLKDIETTENQIMTEVLEQIMTKVLKEVESAEDSEQKTEEVEAEDLMAEELKDEAEDEVKTKTDETTVKPQIGAQYGDSSYGNRASNIGGSSSFSRISFGGPRFSNPVFSRNFASGPNFGRNGFGSGNGRTSFHHQPFGLSSF